MHESENSVSSPTIVTSTLEPEPPKKRSTPPGTKKSFSKQSKQWLSKSFSFRLRNFRLSGGDISLRRFSITEAALLLMMGYIASRGLGVVRQTLFNDLFGTGPAANAYYAAARLPDTLFDLIAGGALTHAFIPVFLSYDKEYGQREAWRLASLVFNVLLVVLTAFVLLAEFIAPTFVSQLLVPGYSPAEQALTTSLTRIMLVQPLILGLGTVITAILNSRRQFLLPALSLAVYNIGLIGGLGFSLVFPRIGIYGPTYGVLAAAFCHVVVMVPGLVKQKVRYSFIWNVNHPGLREVMRLLGPNALAVATASIGLIVETAYISHFSDTASLSAIHNAQMLFALPVALIAQAVGQAALPQLTMQAAAQRYVRMRGIILKLLGTALVLSLIAALLLYLFGKPTIHLIFQHGAFTRHSSSVTGTALMGYAIALPAAALVELLVLGFYALKDARTPLLTNICALAIRWGLIVSLIHVLSTSRIILAIPLALAGSSLAESLLLAFLLFRYLRKKVKIDRGMLRLQRRQGSA
ncbi:MAG: murein biosynthesis integral membrane protein MurJ [Chloroflexota bacterium]|nr:murein biosynthesis integral membrane protein MurJ [Chloroflexota bacterium]